MEGNCDQAIAGWANRLNGYSDDSDFFASCLDYNTIYNSDDFVRNYFLSVDVVLLNLKEI